MPGVPWPAASARARVLVDLGQDHAPVQADDRDVAAGRGIDHRTVGHSHHMLFVRIVHCEELDAGLVVHPADPSGPQSMIEP